MTMDKVWIYFGPDSNFENIIKDIDEYNTIGDLLNFISKQEITIDGIEKKKLNLRYLII